MSGTFEDPLLQPILRPVYVFDIDGTLADGSHRLRFIIPPHDWPRDKNGVATSPVDGTPFKKDWDSYFAAADGDTLIRPVAEILLAIHRIASIVYCTTRVAENIPATEKWLNRQGLPLVDIFHRAPGDFRDDHIVKLELLKEIEAAGYRIIMIFDDRRRVVLAARGAGYTVAHIAEGDF